MTLIQTIETQYPACRECFYNEPYKGGAWWFKFDIPMHDTCRNPSFIRKDVITGEPHIYSCIPLRSLEEECGESGKGFKAK